METREEVNWKTFGKMKMYEDQLVSSGGTKTTGNEEVDYYFKNTFLF